MPTREELLSWFQHVDRQAFVRDRLGSDPWITLCRFTPLGGPESGGVFCALLPNKAVADALKETTWDLLVGSHTRPGFTTYGDGRRRPLYEHFPRGDPLPLVLVRDFESHRESCYELLEEFRLFHNLFFDHATGTFFRVDENGDEEEVARISRERVEVLLRPVRQFCAVKRMHLAVFWEHDRFIEEPLAEIGLSEGTIARVDAPLLTFEVFTGELRVGGDKHKSFSRFRGKKLFPPLPISQCGLAPYDEERRHEEFVIGVDENGGPLSYSCDPSKLGNYFGANPQAPQFLTPVFFRREVLSKYYSDSAKYVVEDSYLRCRGSWSLRMDNNHPKYVIVFLGDLGQSLGSREQQYWRSFNVGPDGGISGVYFRRSFLAEWAPSESPDLVFKDRLEQLQALWTKRFGWPLFVPLTEGDAHLLETLHLPLGSSQGEFDAQVLALTKTVIDSLNEKMLAANLVDVPKDARGISKFELFLRAMAGERFRGEIRLLRRIQELRSSGVGHRKGRSYEDAIAAFRHGSEALPVVFGRILMETVAMFDALGEWVGS